MVKPLPGSIPFPFREVDGPRKRRQHHELGEGDAGFARRVGGGGEGLLLDRSADRR